MLSVPISDTEFFQKICLQLLNTALNPQQSSKFRLDPLFTGAWKWKADPGSISYDRIILNDFHQYDTWHTFQSSRLNSQTSEFIQGGSACSRVFFSSFFAMNSYFVIYVFRITPFKTDVDQNERNEVPWSVHIYKYVQPVIVLGGLAGNILSFLVMSSKYMKQFSFSVYLKTLGVLDSLVLLHYGMTYIDIINYNQSIFTFRMTSYAACMVYPYLIRGIQLSSAWCVVAFSIDRALAIGKPFFAYQHMSTARSRLVVCCVILAAMFSQIYHPILLDKRSSFCHDPFSFPLTSSGLHAMELLVLTSRSTLLMFLPFAIVLACNISVITAVRRRSFLRETNRDLSTDSSQGLNKVRRQDTDRKLSIKLLSISITFLLLSLPEVIVVIMDFKNILGRVDSWYSQHTEFRSIASMIFSLNFAINFLLYGLSFKKRILLWPACCTCLSKLNTGKPCPVRSRKDTPPLVLHLI